MLLLSLLVSIESYSQITIVPVNKKILFNTYNSSLKDSLGLDIDNDANSDLFISSIDMPGIFTQSWFSNTSNYFNSNPPNVVYSISYLKNFGDPVVFNSGFGFYTFCEDYWVSQNWPQSVSDRYLGFTKVIMSDTIYGWIKLRYRIDDLNDPYFKDDTIEVVEYAINTQINDPITAGQTSPNAVNEVSKLDTQIDIEYKNGNILIQNKSDFPLFISIYDLAGKTILNKSCLGNTLSTYSAQGFQSGIYIVNARSQFKSKLAKKIFIE